MIAVAEASCQRPPDGVHGWLVTCVYQVDFAGSATDVVLQYMLRSIPRNPLLTHAANLAGPT